MFTVSPFFETTCTLVVGTISSVTLYWKKDGIKTPSKFD